MLITVCQIQAAVTLGVPRARLATCTACVKSHSLARSPKTNSDALEMYHGLPKGATTRHELSMVCCQEASMLRATGVEDDATGVAVCALQGYVHAQVNQRDARSNRPCKYHAHSGCSPAGKVAIDGASYHLGQKGALRPGAPCPGAAPLARAAAALSPNAPALMAARLKRALQP